MNLIGEFHPASGKGNRYTLTPVCMLTGFTFCIPIKSKKAEDVVNVYMNNIYVKKNPYRQWYGLEEQDVDRGVQETPDRAQDITHLLALVQRKDKKIP